MSKETKVENFSPWLHRFAKTVAGATFILIFIGGLVTSTDSGLAVPDWPTTYGHFMFSFPLSQMVGGILYEHGHRMVATVVGMLMVVLAGWLWLKESRAWVRRLALIALLAVVVQGILGGLTVLFLLPTPISVGHATLAQTFFCLTVALAIFTSKSWLDAGKPQIDRESPSLRTLTIATAAAVYVQLILGAVMRHTNSGLAIPDFPLAFGQLIPPFTSEQVVIHFAHRLGAMIVTVTAAWTIARVWKSHRDTPALLRPALAMACALMVQITLGAFTIWTKKAVLPTTAHVATGAFILGTSVVLALRAFRLGAANAVKMPQPAAPQLVVKQV